ncbi:DUF4136 domain-containing protein [uncultured Dokdonia sp.]|uniref:DUF4136 domain-containing protein n=1 Tax=uncultured Dokdonia sp. TaxID=575653 RepID=UPI00262EE72B|nr:DUF4136 domain-containing protein [uncultured Dokdonia sp.]
MKALRLLPLLAIMLVVSSCSTVRVASDYDQTVNFNDYKTYAFYKPGIDKAEISDLDKKRVLRAIETEMAAKGFTKSENPAVLISIFAKANKRIDVYQNNRFGFGGFGWGGFGWGGFNRFGWGGFGPWGGAGFYGNTVSERTEGILYIDLLDVNKKQLVWQGKGTASLISGNVDKREARIQEIVKEIMEVYPPALAENNSELTREKI